MHQEEAWKVVRNTLIDEEVKVVCSEIKKAKSYSYVQAATSQTIFLTQSLVQSLIHPQLLIV